jgi:hypothetical protein
LVAAVSPSAADQAAARTQAYYERLTADRQAKLNSAMAQLADTNGSMSDLARSIENRHAALAMLLTDAKGQPGAAQALTPAVLTTAEDADPLSGVHAVEMDQDRLIARAETFAKSRADRLRLAFRLAGLDPSSFSPVSSDSLGGPLIDAKDPRALAAVLDVDEPFAARIEHAANDLSDLHNLTSVADFEHTPGQWFRRAHRPDHRPAGLPSRPRFRRPDHDAGSRDGAGRGLLHRSAQRLRQCGRDRSWPWP